MLDDHLTAAVDLGPYQSASEPTGSNAIDHLVLRRLAKAGITPARICSDSTFLRRVTLDTTGTIPSPQIAKEFPLDQSSSKRSRLVASLLADDRYADFWAMRWSDCLRIKSEFPINLWPLAAQAYHQWVLQALRDNRSYRWIARELLLSTGSNFRNPPANFFRAVQGKDPMGIARAVALTFLGQRADSWPKRKLENLDVFFSRISFKGTAEWKEEIVYDDITKPLPAKGTLPDGTQVALDPSKDPREVFVNWLTNDKNLVFSRAGANRVWAWLLGRGIVDPADDDRPGNPPTNPELLDALAHQFVASHFDLKALIAAILTSDTYQLASVPRSSNPAGPKLFAYYPIHRLEAEVLLDALNQITGATDGYSSKTPEPYTFVPEELRSVDLADGSVTSAFLELFGRPPRDSGFANERNERASADQRLHMLNSTHIQRKLENGPTLRPLLNTKLPTDQAVTNLYLAVLSRLPSSAELAKAVSYVDSVKARRTGLIDITWALINSVEFQFRH